MYINVKHNDVEFFGDFLIYVKTCLMYKILFNTVWFIWSDVPLVRHTVNLVNHWKEHVKSTKPRKYNFCIEVVSPLGLHKHSFQINTPTKPTNDVQSNLRNVIFFGVAV